jgi:hypothetical protein
MTRYELLKCMNAIEGLPQAPRRQVNRRMIYEAGAGPRLDPSGHWFIDYASYPGGTREEVPRALIDSLEAEGVLKRAFPKEPHIKAWILAEDDLA